LPGGYDAAILCDKDPQDLLQVKFLMYMLRIEDEIQDYRDDADELKLSLLEHLKLCYEHQQEMIACGELKIVGEDYYYY